MEGDRIGLGRDLIEFDDDSIDSGEDRIEFDDDSIEFVDNSIDSEEDPIEFDDDSTDLEEDRINSEEDPNRFRRDLTPQKLLENFRGVSGCGCADGCRLLFRAETVPIPQSLAHQAVATSSAKRDRLRDANNLR